MQTDLSEKLSVLRGILSDRLFSAYTASFESEKNLNIFLNILYESRCEQNLLGYIGELILTDENAFSVCCAERRKPSEFLKRAYTEDIEHIFALLKSAYTGGRYSLGELPYPMNIDDASDTCGNLEKFYGKHGFGKFIRYSAFYFDGGLQPVGTPSKISLGDLKDYESEKRSIEDNLLAFLDDLPFADMLLYGDKGTGKSSTVHAFLNKYADKGLKLIEITSDRLYTLPQIRRETERLPFKFIVFSDDLTADDKTVSSMLKSVLQGSVNGRRGNLMFVATTNMRNIVSENFSDRQNAVHASEFMESSLSLSDRFGLTVMFSSTGKEQYLSIVKQLADDAGLKTEQTELFAAAERWALIKGGRSPRRAKQIVDIIYSRTILGKPIRF